jgi:hypothetical protein
MFAYIRVLQVVTDATAEGALAAGLAAAAASVQGPLSNNSSSGSNAALAGRVF